MVLFLFHINPWIILIVVFFLLLIFGFSHFFARKSCGKSIPGKAYEDFMEEFSNTKKDIEMNKHLENNSQDKHNTRKFNNN